jgi:uncharacterized protein involved in cysteine biosynthesis
MKLNHGDVHGLLPFLRMYVMARIGLLLQALKHLKIGGSLPGGKKIPDNPLTRSLASSAQLLQSTGAVVSDWRLLKLAIWPIILGFVAFIVAFIFLFFIYYDQVVLAVFGKTVSSIAQGSDGKALAMASSAATGVVMFFVSLMLSALIAFFAMNGLGVFFFERMALEAFFDQKILKKEIIDAQGTSIGVSTRLMLGELVRLVIVALVAVVALILGMIPLISIFSAILLSFLFGYEFVDLAMSVLRLSMWARIKMTLKHMGQVLGLGMMFTFLLAVPFGIIVFYPVACHAGAVIVSRWELPEQGRLAGDHHTPLELELEE